MEVVDSSLRMGCHSGCHSVGTEVALLKNIEDRMSLIPNILFRETPRTRITGVLVYFNSIFSGSV